MAESPKRRITVRCVVVGTIVLFLLAILGAYLYVNHLVSTPMVWQTSGPTPLQEASTRCPIPLPATATNIQYAAYRRWQAYEAFVRFEAPVVDCLAHVDKINKLHMDHHPPSDVRIRWKPIDPAALVLKVSGLPSSMKTSWFDLQRIQRGQWIKGGGSHVPAVWVDEDRGLFYYHVTD